MAGFKEYLKLLLCLLAYLPLSCTLSKDLDFIQNLLSTAFAPCFKSIILNQESQLHYNNDFFKNLNSQQNGNMNIWTAKSNGDGNLTNTNSQKLVAKESHCSVGLLSLHSFKPELITKWIHKLDGNCDRDKDYFIFHMESIETLDQLLLSPTVSTGVKFKIGVSSTETSPEYLLRVRSVCIYCNDGHPKLLTIQVTSQNPPSIGHMFPNYVKDFHGYRMKISTPLECLWLTEIRLDEDGKWKPIRGYHNYGLFHLMRKLNFTGVFFPSLPTGGTGTRFPNGSWNGVIGDVLSGRAEIGQANAQLYSRTLVVDYFFPFTYVWLGFTTGEPQPYFSWRGAYRPLSGEVWLLTFFSAVLMGFVIKLFCKLSGEKFCARVVFEFIIRSLLEQGDDSLENSSSRTSSSSSTKVLGLFWLIFVMIIMTGYKSKLVTFLAFPIVDNPPSSFESLADSSYEIILQFTGAAYHLIKSSTNPAYVKITKNLIKEPSDARCLQIVLERKAACISWANIVNYVSHKNFSHSTRRLPFVQAPASGHFVQGGMITRKKSIYTEDLSFYIKVAMNMGIIEKWIAEDNVFVANERKSWEKATNNTAHNNPAASRFNEDAFSDELNLTHLSVAFYILTAGSSLGVMCFLCEVWKAHRKVTKMKSTSFI